MSRRRFIALLLALTAFTGAYAQKLTLRDCMEYALENSAKLRIQEAATDDALVTRRDAVLATFTPKVQAGTNAYGNFGRSVDPQTNTYVSTASFSNGYSLSGGMDIFNGFYAVNNMKIARTSVLMGRQKEQQLRDEICLGTMEAYCNVVYYSRLAEIIDDQVSTMEEALLLSRRQEELGQKGYADVVQAEADLADLQYKAITVRNSLADAMMTLKDMMFWDPSEDLEIETGDSALESMPLLSDVDARPLEDDELTFIPAVALAKGKLSNASLELKTAKWQFLPNLSLYGGWSTSYYTYPGKTDYEPDPFHLQFRNNGGEYVQLSLTLPIFNRANRFSTLRKTKNAYRTAAAEYDITLREVRSEIERAGQDFSGAEAAYFQALKREQVQEQAWDLNRKKYAQGLISPIDFRKAADNLLNAKAEMLNAMLRRHLKGSVVRYYDGVSYIDQF